MRNIANAFCVAILMFSANAGAQGVDPRVPLRELIQAFQNCGPPVVYQMLSPELFHIIAAQTRGMGCYPQIRAAGQIENMTVLDERMFPNGPVYVIRVEHVAGAVDWFIGFNRYTGKVALLTFQPATSTAPTVEAGPQSTQGGGNPAGQPQPAPGPQGSDKSNGCKLYPAMC